MSTFLGAPTRVTGSGRTDAGVHALGQVANFRCDREPDLHRLRRGLTALTPPDISVKSAEIVPESFDARRDARSRTYEYRILNRPSPSPFYLNYAWHLHDPLDVRHMGKAVRFLEGEHDFSSFRASGCDAPHPVRTVYRASLESDRRSGGFHDRSHGLLAPYGAQYYWNPGRSRTRAATAPIVCRIAGSARSNPSRSYRSATRIVLSGSEVLGVTISAKASHSITAGLIPHSLLHKELFSDP